VAIYQISEGDLLIVGSQQPLATFRSITSLPWALVNDSRAAYNPGSSLITGGQGLRAWLGQGPLNTDDNGLLEFGAPEYLLSDVLSENKKAVWSAPWQEDFSFWFDDTFSGEIAGVDQWLKVAGYYLVEGRLDRAEYIGSRLSDHSDAKELLADIALLRGDRFGAYSLWRESATPSALLKLARFELEQGGISTADNFLDQVPINDRSDRFYYLKSLIHASRGEFESTLVNLNSVTNGAGDGLEIIATGLQQLFKQRLDPSYNLDWQPFKTLLDSMRRELEYEQGQQIMQDLMLAVEKSGQLLLTRAEHRSLQLIIQQHIITPMPVYYRAVAQLWLGEFALARTNFKKYLALLPETDTKSRAYTLLKLSAKNSDVGN
jgi:hypothetical protein